MKSFKYIFFALIAFAVTSNFVCAQTKTSTESAMESIEKKLTPEELEYQRIQAEIDQFALDKANSAKECLKKITQTIRGVSPKSADILEREFFGIRIVQYLISVFILLFTYAVGRYLLSFLFSSLDKFFHKRKVSFIASFAQRMKNPINMLAWVMGIYFSLVFLLTDASSIAMFSRASAILFWGAIFWGVMIFSDVSFEVAAKKLKTKSADSMANLFTFLNRVVKFFISIIAVLFVLNNCGVNVNTIVASLGIGGMALAFASQDTIANFFGSVSIILDRPFIVGDWIKTNSCEGIVEAIGFRSTRVRTFNKSLVTIPNSILAKDLIENFSKMPIRRSKQVLGLTYSTTADQLEAFLPELRETVLAVDGVVKKTGVVVEFIGFGASSLDVELTFFTKETAGGLYKETVRNVNLAIMRLVEKHGLSFAFPSLSLYVEKDSPKA